MFHKHEWDLVARTYSPPVSSQFNYEGNSNVISKAMFGFSQFILKCSKCGEIRTEELLGAFLKE